MTTLAQVERYISILENEIERAKFFKENLMSYENQFFLVENEKNDISVYLVARTDLRIQKIRVKYDLAILDQFDMGRGKIRSNEIMNIYLISLIFF